MEVEIPFYKNKVGTTGGNPAATAVKHLKQVGRRWGFWQQTLRIEEEKQISLQIFQMSLSLDSCPTGQKTELFPVNKRTIQNPGQKSRL